MARMVSSIVEVAVPSRGGSGKRYLAALRDLRCSSFKGFRVVGVRSESRAEPYRVPDFGHDRRCKCKHPQPNGVDRYFGVSFCVSGEPDVEELLGTYELSEAARVCICGIDLPEETVERNRIGD